MTWVDGPFLEDEPHAIPEVLWGLWMTATHWSLLRVDVAERREFSAAVDEVCADLGQGIGLVLASLSAARERLGEDAVLDSAEVTHLMARLDARLDADLRMFRISRRLRSATEAYLDRPPGTFSNASGVPKRRYELVDPVHPAARFARARFVVADQKRLRQLLDRLEQDQFLLFQELETRLAPFESSGGEGSRTAARVIDALVSQFELLGAKVKNARLWVRAALRLDDG